MILLLKLKYLSLYAIENTLDKVNKFSDIKIFYEDNNFNFCLVFESFNFSLINFRNHLLDVLNNKLALNEKMIKPLGYYSTKYFKNEKNKDLIYRKSTNPESPDIWIGLDYLLFSSSKFIPSSWLYNDKNGNIVLEISPIYPWLFSKPKPNEKVTPYKEWMENYQPHTVKTIPRRIALKWLTEINSLIKKTEKAETFLCTGPGCKHCAKEGKTGCPCRSKP